MNLEELMEKGGFVPPDLVKKEVTWKDAKGGPATFDIFVKVPSAGTVDRHSQALKASGADLQAGFAPRPMLISATVFFDAEGKQGITYEKAFEMKEGLCKAIFLAVTEVINDGAEAAKNSRPPTNSGTSSSSTGSAAKRLRKQKNA